MRSKYYILELFVVLICLLISGCSVSMQYTVPNKINESLTDEDQFPLNDFGVCASCFKYTRGAISKEFIYQNVKLYINPTKKCTTWLFGIIPFDNTACEFSLHRGQIYRIYLVIKNISSEPIMFYKDNIYLTKQGETISFNLENTNQIGLGKEANQVYIENDKKEITMMPNDNIEIMLIVGNWSKIGPRLQLDLAKALSSNDDIRIMLDHLTARKTGLLVWE